MSKFNILIFIALAIGVGSCKDDFDPTGNLKPSLTARYLYSYRTEFNFYNAEASTYNFTVESIETPWAFTSTPSWLSLSPAQGNSNADITITASSNPSGDTPRTAIFYLASQLNEWNYNIAMSASQVAATPSLTAESTDLSFGGGAESQTIAITSNCTWNAECSYSWVSLATDTEAGTLTISVEPNPNSSYRTAYAYLNYGSFYTTIYITQYPSEISASESTLTFGNEAGKYTVSIKSQADWTTTVSHSWISVTPSSGSAGTTNADIEVTPNTGIYERSGYVLIYTGGNRRLQISIKQKGLYLEADCNKLEFTSGIQSKTFEIESNIDWAITDKPNWLSLSKESGTGNTSITATTTDNPYTTSRSGYIVISKPGLDLKLNIKVQQAGKYFTAGSSLLQFTDKASSQNLKIESDAKWLSILSDSWFSTSALNGQGDADITVTVEENKTAEERTGSISYQYCEKSTNVNIHQLAKYATIDNKAFTFDSKGGSSVIELLTNEKWTATIENDTTWLSLSSKSGTGDANLTLTVKDNASINKRSTSILITPEYSQAIRIMVTQNPRYLTIDAQSIIFFATGGTSDVVQIDSDGSFEISNSDTWFTVNKLENNTFTVFATQNNSVNMRQGSVTIRMTGLTEGSFSIELPVIQAGESFIFNGFEEDNNWNDKIGDDALSVAIIRYTTDKNWNDHVNSKITINVSGYTTDHDYNKHDKSNGKVSINPYGIDSNWNNHNNGNGNIGSFGYNDDIDWNNDSITTKQTNITKIKSNN